MSTVPQRVSQHPDSELGADFVIVLRGLSTFPRGQPLNDTDSIQAAADAFGITLGAINEILSAVYHTPITGPTPPPTTPPPTHGS